MDAKHINLFLEAFTRTLGQFGVTDVKRGGIKKKANMFVDMEVSAVIGINGNIQGNVALSMSQNTAMKVVSAMMMGMNISDLDDMAKSAIGELSSMIAGAASTLAAAGGASFHIIPPSILIGNYNINPLETLAINFETQLGIIELNIGLTA